MTFPRNIDTCQPSSGHCNRDTNLSRVGISIMMLGKDRSVRGISLLIKELLKIVGPSWEGKEVRLDATQRMLHPLRKRG